MNINDLIKSAAARGEHLALYTSDGVLLDPQMVETNPFGQLWPSVDYDGHWVFSLTYKADLYFRIETYKAGRSLKKSPMTIIPPFYRYMHRARFQGFLLSKAMAEAKDYCRQYGSFLGANDKGGDALVAKLSEPGIDCLQAYQDWLEDYLKKIEAGVCSFEEYVDNNCTALLPEQLYYWRIQRFQQVPPELRDALDNSYNEHLDAPWCSC